MVIEVGIEEDEATAFRGGLELETFEEDWEGSVIRRLEEEG